ncbi:hypothetical protein CORC01_05360 [Colletotrichum orchidophilum]|uniref:Uncharacterized protein n=1 Tax=Colletotrichum orchidophilum TaxID=1209926 RepID=A0A1G4BD15_9PEZI|nr:uncharacterized protein CORC01_05360 [Colletotrichum orchidophilum]OHE99319.1 hypothetical protein CORC01_05360 [Colletotrichum orchidophilum]
MGFLKSLGEKADKLALSVTNTMAAPITPTAPIVFRQVVSLETPKDSANLLHAYQR